jgi:selenium metabolism protein YedF
MAEKAGWRDTVMPEGGEFRLELSRRTAAAQPAPLAVGRAEALSEPRVLVVPADSMGRGEAELGQILIRSFFHTLGEVQPRPQTIVLFNTGVRLACHGSPVLDDLRALEGEGIEVLACGTCLNFLELSDQLAAGRVSNMYDIAETLLGAGQVLSL